ncbi:unnamed protein product [Ophioblennius macclurei]
MATVEPVLQLRQDLRFRLGQIYQQRLANHPSNWEQVLRQIYSVQEQQTDIIADLQAEYLDLEKEIKDPDMEKYVTPDNSVTAENIPQEVLDSDCPYPELKDSMILAFLSLAEKYQSRLQILQQQLQQTDRFCGWSPEHHQQFVFILSQYTYDIPNYKELCMDMLLRVFPGKTKQELLDHGRLWDSRCYVQTQLTVATQRWQRDREELRLRALVTLQEAKHAHQAELEHHRDRQHQQDICMRLKEKVHQWQAQQEEVAKLEAAMAARFREEEGERSKKQQEKQAAMKSQQKDKIKQFHLKQQKRKDALEQRDQDRLAKLRSAMEEQARRDKERVQFRADLLEERRMEREARELEQLREEQERENRLQALRNQVEVVAQADPARMMADTEAWRSRHLNAKEFELQRPLFNINTYTDPQILSDPRMRIERALREAGVHRGQYAQQVLAGVKPHKPPRRDTQSTL